MPGWKTLASCSQYENPKQLSNCGKNVLMDTVTGSTDQCTSKSHHWPRQVATDILGEAIAFCGRLSCTLRDGKHLEPSEEMLVGISHVSQ